MASPEIYLSAFAVAKSLMQLIQSPVMMVRQAVTSLVKDSESYYKVRRFIIAVVAMVVGIFAIMAFSGLGRWVFENIMGIKGDILDKAVITLRVLMLFPAAVTLRSFMQGIAIKFEKNPVITVGTTMRIIFVTLMVIFINKIPLPGAVIAGLMFLGAVTVEALVVFIGTKVLIKDIPGGLDRMKNISEVKGQKVTNNLILTFFTPLAATALIRTLAKPIINTGLARTPSPEVAISAYAVAWGLGIIFVSPLMMFHQVPINYVGEKTDKNLQAVKRFAIYLGIFLSILLSITAFTNLGYYIIRNWIGATEQISKMSIDVLKLMSIYPIIRVAREFYWGLLMKRHMTKYISRAKVIGLIVLTITIFVMTLIKPANPAIIGIIGMLFSQAGEFLYLFIETKKHKDQVVEENHKKAC